MKNLSLVSLESESVFEDSLPTVYCVSNEALFALVDETIIGITSNGDRHVHNLRNLLEDFIQNSIPISLHGSCNPGELTLCVANGNLIAINIEVISVQCVGCFEPGIATAAWSPVGDVFAVVTTSNNVVLLNQELEAVAEVELEKSGEEQLISVGWGKQETQFRGSEGKLKEIPASQVISGLDDQRCRISWRGDGEHFVVSFFANNTRNLRVISKDGTLLHNNEEKLTGLESALCWRPNGSIIASTQKLPNKRMVCFFEKNLLPHGGFEIQDKEIVDELLWNYDSSILAVVIKNANQIKLYTVGNYHWYHKYTVTTEGENLVWAQWDEADGCMLHVMTHKGNVANHHKYLWRWSVDSSSGCSKDDLTWVAVVDGRKLLLTDFKSAVIPPPMSSTILEHTEPVNAVGFLQNGAENDAISSNCLFVYCADRSISTYRFDKKEKQFVKMASGTVPGQLITQIAWVAENEIVANATNQDGKQALIVINLSSFVVSQYPRMEPIVAIRRIPTQEKIILWEGSRCEILNLLDFNSSDCDLSKPDLSSSRLLSVEIRDKIYALDSSHRMHIGCETIARNVTSFCLTDTHLLMTTLQHKLVCFAVGELSERPVERGARLIAAVPGTSSVILQLPRGNLEVVLPRALTISTLKVLLDNFKYLEAITVMRRERINLNLIYDHNSRMFEENINRFLDQISDSSLLCPFIAELSTENVTKTLYSNFYLSNGENSGKEVSMVCALLLSGMECRQDKHKYMLPILSCLVKKGDPEQAILLVQSILTEEKRRVQQHVSSSEGLSHILYLMDVEQLFKIALGTYDLSLVMFIASKSQKDPKEYLPFLANLQQMEENYQKFTIDNFLKRYKKALAHLAVCSDRVKECLDFVVKHNLYRDALKLFAQDSDTWKAVCVLYGAELTRLSRHEEAGLILQRAGEFLLARHAFARAGAWRQELFCAEALNIPEDEKAQLFKTMVENLLTARRYTEAAALCLEHIGDVEAGIDALCSAHQHDEAMRVACLHKRNDLIGSLIKPSALLASDTFEQTITDATENFERHLSRLRIVRLNQDNNLQDWDDSSSESSRGSSRASSTRSAKNTRKLERNLMKQGGVFEKDALIAAIHDVVAQTTALKSQVRVLNLALVALNEQAAAAKLQNIYKEFLDYIQPGVRETWPVAGAVAEQESTSNYIAAEFGAMKRQLPAPVQAIQPKVLFPPDQSNRVEWQLEILLD